MQQTRTGNIVLAGGSGFLGTELAKVLVQLGYSVTVLSRSAKATIQGVKVVKWDPHSDDTSWYHAIENATAVVNLAGANVAAKRWSLPRRQEIERSRVESTRALVAAVNAQLHIENIAFIQTSGTGYYGHAYEPLTEASPHGQTYLSYVVNIWENATKGLTPKTRLVILRLAAVLHPKEGALAEMVPYFKAGIGGRLGKGSQWFAWVHYEDAVNAYVNAIEDARLSGIYNIAAPGTITMNELAASIAKTLHRPNCFPVPAFVLRLLLGRQADIVLHSQNVRPMRTLGMNWSWHHPYIHEALQDLLQK